MAGDDDSGQPYEHPAEVSADGDAERQLLAEQEGPDSSRFIQLTEPHDDLEQ